MAQKVSGVVIPHKLKWHGRLAAACIYVFARALFATLRVRISPETQRILDGLDQNAVFAIWHNRLAISLPIYNAHFRPNKSSQRLAALVSASRDGALLARVLELFGVQPVRGSSSRRGAQAMLELCTWAGRGFDLAVTPDGPRGPVYQVQDGVIALAQLTGRPFIPVTMNFSRKLVLKSWDKFQIPLPFSICELILGEPLEVPRELPGDERERYRQRFQDRLMANNKD